MHHNPTGLPTFLTDGSIIQEQPDHLVVAVRIPKSTINANLHLFAALADSAGSGDTISAPATPQPGKKKPNWVVAALLLVAVLLPSPFGDLFRHGAAGPLKPPGPVSYSGWQMAKPEFAVGEDIDILASYRRDRVCQTTIDRVIKHMPDDFAVYNTRVFIPPMGLTGEEPQKFRHRVHLHQPLPPGNYIYSGLTHSECAQGGAYDEPHPQLTFTVVEPNR